MKKKSLGKINPVAKNMAKFTRGKIFRDRKKELKAGIQKHKKPTIDEALGPNAMAGDYIKDFRKSDAPQFKGKSDKKIRQMAIAAYLSKKESMFDEINRHGIPKDATKAELKKIRSNPNSSKGAKNLAHWKLNMHHNESFMDKLKKAAQTYSDAHKERASHNPLKATPGSIFDKMKEKEKSKQQSHQKAMMKSARDSIKKYEKDRKNVNEDAEYDPTPGGMEWGTDKGTNYYKKLTPGEGNTSCPKCGCKCGETPCKTCGTYIGKYVSVKEEFKPHWMFKGKKKEFAKKPEDHDRLKKLGYSHDNPLTKKIEEYVSPASYVTGNIPKPTERKKAGIKVNRKKFASIQNYKPQINKKVDYDALSVQNEQEEIEEYENFKLKPLKKLKTGKTISKHDKGAVMGSIKKVAKLSEEGEAGETKKEYRDTNKDYADEYVLTDKDWKALEYEAENITWEQILDMHLYDESELDVIDGWEEEDEYFGSDINITEVLSVQGRLKRRFAARRNKQKLKVARNIALRRGSTPDRLKLRATRGARLMVYKRLLRGRDRSSLPPAEKARLETRVKQFQPLVSRIAQKLLPGMRKLEISRMKGRNKKPQKSKKYKVAKVLSTTSKKSKKFGGGGVGTSNKKSVKYKIKKPKIHKPKKQASTKFKTGL